MWQYEGKDFDVDFRTIMVNGWYGFIYRIDNNLNGMSYIGKKNFISVRKRNRSESNWSVYYGSCEPLTQHVIQFGSHNFTRTILSIHNTKEELSYYEVKAMFDNDILYAKNEQGLHKFYNSMIFAGRFFRYNNRIVQKL